MPNNRSALRLLLYAACLLLIPACSLRPQPARPPLSILMAEAEPLIAAQQYGQAINILEEAASYHPETPLPLIRLGQIYLRQHRWLLAEDAFNRALARDLDNPLAIAGLAESLFNQRRLSDALRAWQRATMQYPDLPGVWTGLGQTRLWRFEFEAAETAFRQEATNNTGQPAAQARWYLAALTAPYDLAGARNHLLAIPATAPPGLLERRDYLLAALVPFEAQSPPARIAKAVGISLAQAEQWPLAAHALRIAQGRGMAEDAETLAFLGHAQAQAGYPALELFEQARQADPDSALPLYFEGLYLRQQEALGAAERLFKEAITLDPQNAAIYAELAQTRARQGEISEAELLYRAAVEVAEEDFGFKLLLARFYAGQDYRVAEAGIPLVEDLLADHPDRTELYDLLGWMQFLTGQPEPAEANLRRAVELDGTGLVAAHYHLARLLEAQDQTETALYQYRRVVDLDQTGHYRQLALRRLREE